MSDNFLNDSKGFESTQEEYKTQHLQAFNPDFNIKLEESGSFLCQTPDSGPFLCQRPDSGPFLPSFLFSDEESILDVSNTAISSGPQASTISESSAAEESLYVPQLRKCDSKGYEADEDGDFLQHGSNPKSLHLDGSISQSLDINGSILQIPDVTDKGEEVIIDNDKFDGTHKIIEDSNSILYAIEASAESIDCPAAKSKDDLNVDIAYCHEDSDLMLEEIGAAWEAEMDRKEEAKALKDELEEAIGANGMALIKMMDKNITVEGTSQRVKEDQDIRLKDVTTVATAAKEIELKEKVVPDEECEYLSESFGVEKEQEVAVHDENYDESDIEMIFASPANQAFLEDAVSGDEDTRFNDYLNFLGGGLILYFLFMFITLIIYQLLNMHVYDDDVAYDELFEDFSVDDFNDNQD